MGIQSLNDIVNDYSSLRNTNVNDNVEKQRKSQHEIDRADRIADYLCKKIGSRDARAFYCKASYYLSEDTIYRCLEIALKGRVPVKYLSWLLKNELRRTNASRG